MAKWREEAILIEDEPVTVSTPKWRSEAIPLEEDVPQQIRSQGITISAPEEGPPLTGEVYARPFFDQQPLMGAPQNVRGLPGQPATTAPTVSTRPSYGFAPGKELDTEGFAVAPKNKYQDIIDNIGLSEIGKSFREMVAPTTPYTEKETRQAFKEIPRALENIGVRVLTLGGLAGPLMGLKPSQLRAAIDEDAREGITSGLAPALAPAAADTISMAIEWGYIYPKLFAAVGTTGKAISKIPQVAKATEALKVMGGIEKIAEKYPRLVNVAENAIKSFTKGATVGTVTALPEVLGEELPAGDAIKHISKEAAIMGGVASVFAFASEYDTRTWTKQYRQVRLDAHRAKFDNAITQIDNQIRQIQALPDTPENAQFRAQELHRLKNATSSLGSQKNRDLKRIDKEVAVREAQLRHMKAADLYKRGQELIEKPDMAARRAIDSLKIGLGETKPAIQMPTTRVGEAIESAKEVGKAVLHPVKTVQKAGIPEKPPLYNQPVPTEKPPQIPITQAVTTQKPIIETPVGALKPPTSDQMLGKEQILGPAKQQGQEMGRVETEVPAKEDFFNKAKDVGYTKQGRVIYELDGKYYSYDAGNDVILPEDKSQIETRKLKIQEAPSEPIAPVPEVKAAGEALVEKPSWKMTREEFRKSPDGQITQYANKKNEFASPTYKTREEAENWAKRHGLKDGHLAKFKDEDGEQWNWVYFDRDAHKMSIVAAQARGETIPIKVLEEFKSEPWAQEAISSLAPAEAEKGEITSIIKTEAEGHVEDKSRLLVVKENVPAEQIEGLDLKADEWAAKWQKATDEFISKHPELTPEQKRDVVHSAFTGIDETGFEGGGELAKDLHDNYLIPASKEYIKSKLAPAEAEKAVKQSARSKTPAKSEFKIGDVIDTKGRSNMSPPVTIREIKGNTLKFTDAKGVEYAGMARADVRRLIEGGAWERVNPEALAQPAPMPAWDMSKEEFRNADWENDAFRNEVQKPWLVTDRWRTDEYAKTLEGRDILRRVLIKHKVGTGENVRPDILAEYPELVRETPMPAEAGGGKVETPEQEVEGVTHEPETTEEAIVEPKPSAEIQQGQAGPTVSLEPTGTLDPTKHEDALKIIEQHKEYLQDRPRRMDVREPYGLEGIYKLGWKDRAMFIEEVLYSSEQVDKAYRTVQTDVPSGQAGVSLFAMPGKEKDMVALAVEMAKMKAMPTKTGKVSIPRPKQLPKANPNKESHIKGVYVAADKAKEEPSRYGIKGVLVEGENLIATDGRRMFIAKGKWGKDGLYLDTKSLKNGLLGKADKEGKKFPSWKDIMPDYRSEDAVQIDSRIKNNVNGMEDVWRRLWQAKAMQSEESKSVMVILNKDGSLGFATGSPEIGHAEIHVLEGGKILGAVNPDYLLDAMAFHAVRGDKSIELYFPYFDRQILTRAENGSTQTITMPVNPGEPSEELKAELGIPTEKKVEKPEPEPKAEAAKEEPGEEPPEGKLPGGRQAGGTTVLPDVAAELQTIGNKLYHNPAKFSSALSQMINRNARRATNYMRLLGGSGRILADNIDQITYRVTKNTNNDLQDIRNIYRGMSKESRELISKVINEKRTPESVPVRLRVKAEALRGVLDRAMNEANALGMKRKVKGEKIPIGGSGKAYPQALNAKGVAFLEEAAAQGKASARVFAWAQSQVNAGKYEDVDEAITALNRFREQRMRGINLYLEAERVELPDEYIDWDGLHVLPHLIERNWMTVEGVREWGDKFELARSRIERIRQDYGADAAYRVKLFIETSFGIRSVASEAAREISRQIRGYQFVTKVGMSPITIARNMFDRIAKGFTISPMSTIKTFIKYPPFLNQFIRSAQKHEEWLIRSGAVFGHGSLSEGYEAGNILTEMVTSPFSESERGNQVFIGMVQYDKFLKDLADLKGKKDVLGKILNPISYIWGGGEAQIKHRISDAAGEKALEKALKGEELMQEEVEFMLHKAVRDKAFPMILSTKPVWYDNRPFIKALVQFKTWPVQQLNMIWRDVVKYTVKTGDPTRLLGFLIGTLIAGELYNILRDFLFDKKESILSQYLKDPKERETAMAILNDLLDGGVVGMLADFSYGIYDWATGVSARTAANVWETALHIKKKPSLTLQALERLAEKEITPYRQIKRLAEKIDRKYINPKNISKEYYDWRSEGWKWNNAKENPTATDKVKAYTDQVLMGTPDYGVGENTLAYELAARQVIAGDVEDAAKYLKIILADSKKNRKETLAAIRQSQSSRSPLGKIAVKDRNEFLRGYTPERRRNAIAIQNQYNLNYKKAINIVAPEI